MPRLSKDAYFVAMLELVAARSTCARRAVGVIVVDGGARVLSMGYNGVVPGAAHCVDEPCPGAGDRPGDSSRCEAVHAEMNALLSCYRLDLANTMYVSVTPCFTCAKLVLSIPRIMRVVALAPYPGDSH